MKTGNYNNSGSHWHHTESIKKSLKPALLEALVILSIHQCSSIYWQPKHNSQGPQTMGDKFKWKHKPLKQTVKTSNGIFMGTQRKWKNIYFPLLTSPCWLCPVPSGPVQQTGPKSPDLKPRGLLEVNRFILYFPFSGVDFGIGNTGLSSRHHSPFPTTFLLSCSPFPHSLFILHFFPQGNVDVSFNSQVKTNVNMYFSPFTLIRSSPAAVPMQC